MNVTMQKMAEKAIKAVDPENLIKEQFQIKDHKLFFRNSISENLNLYKNIYLIGFGKGVAPMAKAMEALLGNRLSEGCIVVKYDHGETLHKVEVIEAAHPLPDENSLLAGKKILELADKATEDDLVITLITGGGSSLFEQLPNGISLDDLANLNRSLLRCGATISEINTIRKYISLIKGGALAQRIAPASVFSIILSDIIGDPIADIASGPTVYQNKNRNDVLEILRKYKIQLEIPETIMNFIINDRQVNNVPNQKMHCPKNLIVGNNLLSLKAIENVALENNMKPFILTDRMDGEARELARFFAGMAKSGIANSIPLKSPVCIISGGESTVTIKGKGKGGRNQELALAFLNEMKDVSEPFTFCSIGSDGTDGPTDAAGAWVDHLSFLKAKQKNLNMNHYLENNDAYHFFESIDQLYKTGPTRTNVMDFVILMY